MRSSLWVARTTWALLLLVAASYLAPPLVWGFAVAHGGWPPAGHNPEAVGPSGLWCAGDGFSTTRYLEAALLVLASVTLPALVHRRSIARLRRSVVTEIDLSQPGTYRDAPATKPRLERPARTQRSVTARYLARLALSFALVAPLMFLAEAHMGWQVPFTSCTPVVQCYVAPIEYGPLVLIAAGLIVAQLPTRRRALRSFEDICR